MAYWHELDWKDEKEFGAWFWEKRKKVMNGEHLIRSINAAAKGTQKVRYEVCSPYIYAVKMNRLKLAVETKERKDGTKEFQEMYLVKVGFTHVDTSQENVGSRVNKLMKEIQKEMKSEWRINVECSVLFMLSIDALDPRCFFDVEEDIRSKVGVDVPDNVGKALHLPVHTEWVATDNKFIRKIRDRIDFLQRTPSKEQEEVKTPSGACNLGTSTGEKTPPGGSDEDLMESLQNMSVEEDSEQDMCKNDIREPIDTRSVFGQGGVKLGDRFREVSETFAIIEAYEHNEVKVALDTVPRTAFSKKSGDFFIYFLKLEKGKK